MTGQASTSTTASRATRGRSPITDAAGELIIQGIDVIERADDGHIQRVVMFFGDLPAADG